MDYKEVFNNYYDNTTKRLEGVILKTLTKACSEDRQLYSVTNKLRGNIYNEKKLLEEKLKECNLKAFNFFIERECEYNPDNSILLILKNECRESFIGNKDRDVTYEKFIEEVATYESLRINGSNFKNYYMLYELMYVLNDFKGFSLNKIEGGYENSKLYNDLYKRCNPVKIDKPDCFKDVTVSETKSECKLTKYDKEVLGNIKLYSEKDKVILLYSIKYALEKQLRISAIEFSRVLFICKVDDTALFHDNYKNNTTYKKISSGLKYSFTKKLDKFNAIETLKRKNDKFGLKDINIVLDNMLENEVILNQK